MQHVDTTAPPNHSLDLAQRSSLHLPPDPIPAGSSVLPRGKPRYPGTHRPRGIHMRIRVWMAKAHALICNMPELCWLTEPKDTEADVQLVRRSGTRICEDFCATLFVMALAIQGRLYAEALLSRNRVTESSQAHQATTLVVPSFQ
jgi:hypothetical protein